MKLWPGVPPGEIETTAEQVPTLEWFMAERPTGAAVVVCPGGGYRGLADHEAGAVARWLNTLGIAGVVLRYRLSPHRHPTPLSDAKRAIRTVRHRAQELGLDVKRVGIVGFSAGGHLAATVSTHYDVGDAAARDAVERWSSRPDLTVLAYPVISMHKNYAHGGSRMNLLGEAPSDALVWDLSNEERVTPDTPPAFLFHTVDDASVAVENSVSYAMALRRAGVAVELHCYEHGAHGVGLAGDNADLSSWTELCGNWLGRHGFARAKAGRAK